MSQDLATVLERASTWLEQGRVSGWFDESDAARLASVERASPADLIADAEVRPLVVALFGGTGVGKSSLLNRVAGEPIARVGALRPTSREVTVYVHESIELARLPSDLPLDRVQIRRHGRDPGSTQRHILWIDVPDIDSTEEDNRRCALAWLPHVHLVCYVVSPERYRDDAGWRVLQERGHRHGWMFILNRWDEGDHLQRDDFARMLVNAGFENPLLVCTSCAPKPATLPTPDELDRVHAELADLLAAHGVEELSRCGHLARLREVDETLATIALRLGDEAGWQQVSREFQERWTQAGATLAEGLEWPMRTLAGRLAVRNDALVDRLARLASVFRSGSRGPVSPDVDAADPRAFASGLWDEWMQSKLEACLDAVEVTLRHRGIAAAPARRRLDDVARQAGHDVAHRIEMRLGEALAMPGSAVGRVLFRATRLAMTVLPVLALAWVTYTVVAGYFRATTGAGAFLGTDFAVHSILLVAVAWLLPFIAHRYVRPSLEQAAFRALRMGFADGLAELGDRITQSLCSATDEARALLTSAREIRSDIAVATDQPAPVQSEPARRMLARTAAQPSPVAAR